MAGSKVRTGLAYKGTRSPPRLSTPLEKVLGDEYECFLLEWEQRAAETDARTIYCVTDLDRPTDR